MDALIQTLRDKVNSDIPFDLEVLIDDIVNLQNQINANHKEELHAQGRSLQQFYDSIINQLKEIVQSELLYLKNQPSNEQTHRVYKNLKGILNILAEIPTVF